MDQLLVQRVAVVGVGLVAEPALLFEAVPELLAMVAHHRHHRAVLEPEVAQAVEQATHLAVGVGDLGMVEGPEPGPVGRRRDGGALRIAVGLAAQPAAIAGVEAPRHPGALRLGWVVGRMQVEKVEVQEAAAVAGGLAQPPEGLVHQDLRPVLVRGVVVEALVHPEAGQDVEVLVDPHGVEALPAQHPGHRAHAPGQAGGSEVVLARARGVEVAEALAGAVGLRLQAGQQRGDAGQRPGRRRQHLGEAHSLLGEGVEARGEAEAIAVGPQGVGTQGVDQDHHQVAAVGPARPDEQRVAPHRRALGERQLLVVDEAPQGRT